MIVNIWSLLFGHVAGDYFLQTHRMATLKISNSWWAALHSLVYTCCVVAAIGLLANPFAWLIVFATHYPIDRYSIAKKIMEFKGGPDFSNPFAPIIYVIIDNSMHIILMVWLLEMIT